MSRAIKDMLFPFLITSLLGLMAFASKNLIAEVEATTSELSNHEKIDSEKWTRAEEVNNAQTDKISILSKQLDNIDMKLDKIIDHLSYHPSNAQ